MTASPSAILGTALGLTKLAASMRVWPAATNLSMSSTFCAVLRSAGSACKPSRGATSTTWTRLDG